MQEKWVILSAVGCGTFMATLDSSIVNVALPSITASLHTGLSTSRWVVIAYLFSITGLLLFFGKLADVVGRKLIFNSGYVIFTIGSVLCGMSATIEQLVLFRGLQGLGAAMLMANGPALITAAFPPTERGKALGTLAMIVSAGLVTGPILGGVLVRFLNWPSIFFVNLPFGILGTYLVYKHVPATISMTFPEMKGLRAERMTPRQAFDRERTLPFTVRLQLTMNRLRYFDWLGVLFWMFIQFGYSMAIDRDNTLGLAGPLQRLIIFGSAGLLVLFLIWEWSVKDPILDLTLFRSKSFLASNISGVFKFFAISGVALLMPFYFQNIRGLPPHQIGLFMTLIPLTIFFVAPISGRLSDHYGSRLLSVAGMLIICLTMALLSLRVNGLTSSNPNTVCLYLVLVGLGVGLFQSPNNNAIMGAVTREQLGVASALLATVRNFGLVTGAALSTNLLMYYYNIETVKWGPLSGPSQNFVTSLRQTFLALGLICSIGIFTSFVKERRNVAQG